jgi:tetratricopeptide (TPR) repeat protein
MIDPSYAPTAALVGRCRVHQWVQGWGAFRRRHGRTLPLGPPGARSRARRPPNDLQAAYTLFFVAGEAAMAAAALDRALALNLNAAHAWNLRGSIHALRNEPEAAIEAIERARRFSPFDPTLFYAANIAIAQLTARRFEQAIEWADRALHDKPRMVVAMRVEVAANAISAGSTWHAPNSVACLPSTTS